MITVPYWRESLEASLEGYDPGARVTVPDYFADCPGFEEYRQQSPHRILLWREVAEERMVHLGLQARHPIVEVAVTRNDGDGLRRPEADDERFPAYRGRVVAGDGRRTGSTAKRCPNLKERNGYLYSGKGSDEG